MDPKVILVYKVRWREAKRGPASLLTRDGKPHGSVEVVAIRTPGERSKPRSPAFFCPEAGAIPLAIAGTPSISGRPAAPADSYISVIVGQFAKWCLLYPIVFGITHLCPEPIFYICREPLLSLLLFL
jgi:hypothetical protein